MAQPCPAVRHLQRRFFFATDAFQRNRSQPIAPEPDVLLHLSWRIDHFGRVEDGITADEGGESVSEAKLYGE